MHGFLLVLLLGAFALHLRATGEALVLFVLCVVGGKRGAALTPRFPRPRYCNCANHSCDCADND